MTTLKEALYARLAAIPIASGRIYHVKRPDNAVFPCVTYQGMSTQTDRTLDPTDPQRMTREFIMFDVWGKTDASTMTVAGALNDALENYKGIVSTVDISRILLDNENDSYDDGAEIFRRSLMYDIWYRRQ